MTLVQVQQKFSNKLESPKFDGNIEELSKGWSDACCKLLEHSNGYPIWTTGFSGIHCLDV